MKAPWRLFITVDDAYKFDGGCTGRIHGETFEKIPSYYIPVDQTDYICSIDFLSNMGYITIFKDLPAVSN